eukprot:245764_1
MAEENKHHCNCQYSWVIDGASLRRILSAPPSHTFSSDEFSLDALHVYCGQIQIEFNGDDNIDVVTNLLRSNRDQIPQNDVVMIHRGKTSVVEFGQSYTELQCTRDIIPLQYENVIHRSELKEANLEQLTIVVDVQILSVIQQNSLRETVFNKPFAFSGSFQKQQIQCKVESTLLKQMDRYYDHTGRESDIYHGMWGFFYRKAVHFMVYLRCYALPTNVSKMDLKWSLYVKEFHVNETKTLLSVVPHEGQYFSEQHFDIEAFDKVIQCESMTLEHVIEISKMYDMDGQEIKESDWKKHINAKKKKPKKAQFEYSWLIDTNLYEQWLSAEKGKCYSSRTFSLDGLDFQIKVYPKGNHEIDGCYVCVQCMSLPTDCTNVKCFTRIWCDALDFSCRKVDDLSFRKQGKYAQFDCMLPSRWKELMENNDGDNRDRKQDDKDGGILVLNVKFNILQMYRLTEKENILYQYPMNFGKSFQEQQFEWMIDADLMKRLKENVVKHGVFESPIFNDMWCLIIKRARGCVEKAVTDDEEDSDDDSDDDEEKEQGSDGKGDREKENIDYLQMRLALCGFPSSIQTVGIDWSLFVDPINVNKMTEAEVGISMRNPMKFIMIIPWDEFVKQNAESLTFFVSVAIWDMKDEDGDTLSVSAQADCIEKATKEIGFQTSNEEKEVEDQSDAETQEAVVRDLKQNDANVTDLDEIRTQMNALQEDVKVLKQQIVTLKEIDIKQMKKQMAKLSRNQQEDEEKEPSKEEMVRMWLKDTVKLPRYADQFINEGYDDLEMVADMTMDDLINLNIDKRGHRKKILKYANKLEFPNEMQPIPAAAYSQNADKVGVEGTNVYDTSKI